MDSVDVRSKVTAAGPWERGQSTALGLSNENLLDSLHKILSVAIPTFDEGMRFLNGDADDWLDPADLESDAYAREFLKMVDVGVDDDDAFTQDLLRMIEQIPLPIIR